MRAGASEAERQRLKQAKRPGEDGRGGAKGNGRGQRRALAPPPSGGRGVHPLPARPGHPTAAGACRGDSTAGTHAPATLARALARDRGGCRICLHPPHGRRAYKRGGGGSGVCGHARRRRVGRRSSAVGVNRSRGGRRRVYVEKVPGLPSEAAAPRSGASVPPHTSCIPRTLFGPCRSPLVLPLSVRQRGWVARRCCCCCSHRYPWCSPTAWRPHFRGRTCCNHGAPRAKSHARHLAPPCFT